MCNVLQLQKCIFKLPEKGIKYYHIRTTERKRERRSRDFPPNSVQLHVETKRQSQSSDDEKKLRAVRFQLLIGPLIHVAHGLLGPLSFTESDPKFNQPNGNGLLGLDRRSPDTKRRRSVLNM